MRTVLGGPRRAALAGVALGLTVLAACGDEQVGQSPGPRPSLPEPQVVAILSGPATGEVVELQPTDVTRPAALRRFVAPMSEPLAADVTAAVRDHEPADGMTIAAAVIAIGCDVPPSATVVEDGGWWRVVPAKVADPLQECFAAQASVAVVELPLAQQ